MTPTSYENDFYEFGGAAYLNASFHGAIPRVAASAAEEALQLKKTPHLLRDDHHQSFPRNFRAEVAELIEADPNDVAVTNSATDGIMAIAAGLDWSPGDEVVIPKGEFPANLFPWRSLAEKGVETREIRLGNDDATGRLIDACTTRTRVVSASWVSFATGLRLDLDALSDHCRENDIWLVIDGSQGIGGLPFSVRRTPCAVVACASYKWLLGPYGLGFAWIAPELSERLTCPNVNWQSVVGNEDFSRLSQLDLTFYPGARRFDVNEPAAFLNLASGTAALRYLNEVTPSVVEGHVQSLLMHLLDSLPAAFRPVARPSADARSNILCIAPDDPRWLAPIQQALTQAGVIVSIREGAIRISPHLYNTRSHIDQLVQALERFLQKKDGA